MAAALGPAGAWAGRQAEAFSEDPWAYMARTFLRVGAGLVIGGFAVGTGGYFLSASATKAANQEKQVIANMGNIFSNIKSPTWKPAATGTAPVSFTLKGIQNFGQDAWSDLQAGANDLSQIGGAMGTLGEDVANGFIDVAKSLLAFVMHFPDILWNGLVWGIGGALADLMNWIFPYVVILGAALVVLGAVMVLAERAAEPLKAGFGRASARWRERQSARVERFFDRAFHNPTPPVIEALPEAEAQRTQAEGAGERAPAPGSSPEVPATPELTAPPVTPSGPMADAPAPIPAEISTPTPPPEVKVEVNVPPPAGIPTREEMEKHLGEVPNRAPTAEELTKMLVEAEANRQASMPKRPKGVSGYEESRRAQEAFAAAEAA